MKTLSVRLEHCYGIRRLTHAFDFTERAPYSIYAPNGFMKTSLAKTFLDLSRNQNSSDLIFPARASLRSVQDETGAELKSENVFVVEPYREDFNFEKTSLLLVNQVLKKQYEEALRKIDERKEALFKTLRQRSGLSGRTVTPETELLKCFGSTSVLSLLEDVETQVASTEDSHLSTIIYGELFNEKTVPFLESGQIRTQLRDYIETYNELIAKSSVLNKNFNHYHAKTVHKNLADNGFFSAKHSLNLFNGEGKEEVVSAEQFDEKIEEEKKRILSDDGLQKKFDAIDKKLANTELRRFRDYLFDHKEILADLADYKNLQIRIWLSYLAKEAELFQALLSEYRVGKEVIEITTKAARDERTDWEEVTTIFNKRFSVPFKLSVENQPDVILKGTIPKIAFVFQDSESAVNVDRNALLAALSQGEKRALYILNILFELQVRKKQGAKTIVIIDDIADSFDYKNKYAIIEYLCEISKQQDFFLIFLTHNFDFHRAISGRLGLKRGNRLAATKNGEEVTLRTEKYQNNPFAVWKKSLGNPRNLIACIPFVRNLAEYCGMPDQENKLTSLLHIKADTRGITINDLQVIFSSVLQDQRALVLNNQAKLVIDLVFETADAIVVEVDLTPELESKIVLSIAIRLQAELYMINKISDPAFVAQISSNQTRELFSRFKQDFSADTNALEKLDQVNLMTPENIHLNSFMYEPILDMASHHLKALYTDVKALNSSIA